VLLKAQQHPRTLRTISICNALGRFSSFSNSRLGTDDREPNLGLDELANRQLNGRVA